MKKKKIQQSIQEEVCKQMPSVDVGLTVLTPNITKEKMEAILAIANSNLELAKALNSINVKVEFRDVAINNCPTGVHIKSN